MCNGSPRIEPDSHHALMQAFYFVGLFPPVVLRAGGAAMFFAVSRRFDKQ